MLQRVVTGMVIVSGMATAALAQSGGSTYPAGSNLPQRSAGEIAPKGDSQIGGAGAGGNARRTVQGKAASRSGARPHKAGAPVPQPGRSDAAH